MRLRVWSSAATLRIAAGECRMKAKEFNALYPKGSSFIYQPATGLRGGRVVRTVDLANDLYKVTVVEINQEPYFANIKSLKPVN